MKKQLLQTTFILIFTLISTSIFAQKKLKYNKAYFDKFPAYEAVVESYFTENEYNIGDVTKIKFGKKYDGWYVIFLNKNYVEVDERLIWNAKSTSFKNVKTKDTDSGSSYSVKDAKKKYVRGFEPMFFAQYPLYGYHGYENDIIKLLENEKDLSAKVLDALARSYSSKGMQVLMPGQFGGKKKVLEYDRTFNPKDWEKETLNEFTELMDKSIATFKILSDKYPDYQTIVGNIKTKYRNEYMSAYYALKYSGQSKLAEKYLVDDLYPDFQIKTAANYLKTCATNAILFTYGDNDTYPLIYAQDKLGIRPDIKVINTSLASLGRYIHFVKTEYNLPTTLEMADYKLENHNYIGIKPEIEDVDLRDYFKAVSEEKNLYIDDESGVRYLPSKQGFFVIQVKPLGYQLGVAKRLSERAVRFDFKKNYLIKGEVFLLDLITTDNWQTPTYFSSGGYYTLETLGMKDYVQVEGLAYRFLPKETHDFTLLETNVLYVFQYPETTNDWYSSGNSIHLNYYQNAFMELLKFRKTNIQKVKKTLDKMEAVFPHETVDYKYQAAAFADFCYDAELTERGDVFIRNEVKHVHRYFKSIENQKELSYFDKQNIRMMLYTANQLASIAEINEREEFANLADDFQEYLVKYGE